MHLVNCDLSVQTQDIHAFLVIIRQWSSDKEETCKRCFYELMQQLIVKAREEPTLNARGRKYLNTTADADPSKIGR